MDLKQVRIIGGPLVLATPAQVADAQEKLWITFPEGYAEYLTTLGEGVLGGSFVRIHPPWRIVREIDEWRERIRTHWFWDKSKKLLSKERALESVIVGDTVNGDELIFHPGRPDRLFVLPAEAEKVFEVEGDLLDAVEWLCSSGKLTGRFTERDFEPFDSRKKKPASSASKAPDEKPADTLEPIVAELKKWAAKHGLEKAALKSCREWLADEDEPFLGVLKLEAKKEKIKAMLKSQHLVFQPEKYSQPQVVTILTVIDTASGAHLGEFKLFSELDGHEAGSGTALTYPHAVALAENWLGLKVP